MQPTQPPFGTDQRWQWEGGKDVPPHAPGVALILLSHWETGRSRA